MTQSEDYKKGYQDALADIRNEIEQQIAKKEKFLEGFSDEEYVSSVASCLYNINVGLVLTKSIIDKKVKL